MPIDTSIYSAAMPRQKSVIDYQNELTQQDLTRQSLQQNSLAIQQGQQKLSEYTRGIQAQQGIRNRLQSLAPGATDADRANALYTEGSPESIAVADRLRAASDNSRKTNSEAGNKDVDTENKVIGTYRDMVGMAQDPQSAARMIEVMHSDPRLQNTAIARVPLQQALAQIGGDPQTFNTWKQQFGLGAAKFIEQNKPALTTQNLGGSSQIVSTPGLGGPSTVATSSPTTQSPDSIATNATSRANNAATQAGENSRAAANHATQLQVAGMAPGGGLDDNTERTAQAIANGQLPAPTGMALLNPKNQRVLGRVMEINPEYDSTTVDAKKKAARDFTSGTLGNSMRSFNVAGQHLDQLGVLVDALDNGNMQIVNKIGNAYREQTGSAAPTNFDAAKDVVSKEVVKAIVAGGGGVSERQELSELMSKAKSPAQLKGVIQQYRNLMGAQHDALLQQRRAAGLPDSTLPNYAEPGGGASSGVPSEISDILKKHGGK